MIAYCALGPGPLFKARHQQMLGVALLGTAAPEIRPARQGASLPGLALTPGGHPLNPRLEPALALERAQLTAHRAHAGVGR